MLYFAEILELGALPDKEIEKIDFFDEVPDTLSFPLIQPLLIERIKENMMYMEWKNIYPRKQKPTPEKNE